MKLQLGTLDCAYSEKTFRQILTYASFRTLFLALLLPIYFRKKSIPSQDIAILQIDIEGYEYILLEGLLKEVPDDRLPPIIHFEQKVMIRLDKMHPLEEGSNTRLEMAKNLLEEKGYVFIEEKEDILAIRFWRDWRNWLEDKQLKNEWIVQAKFTEYVWIWLTRAHDKYMQVNN